MILAIQNAHYSRRATIARLAWASGQYQIWAQAGALAAINGALFLAEIAAVYGGGVPGALAAEGEAVLRTSATQGVGERLAGELGGAAAAGERLIPWSSKVVRDANAALDRGIKEVNVGSRSEAEELFLRRYAGDGYRNTTGMSPRETKSFFGQKAGTYHWDIGADAYPHGANHLQVHTHSGDVVRIFFP